jgi:hypothetical protein
MSRLPAGKAGIIAGETGEFINIFAAFVSICLRPLTFILLFKAGEDSFLGKLDDNGASNDNKDNG